MKSQINVQYRNQYRNQTNNNPTTPVAKTNCITDLGPASFHSQGEGQESGQLKLTIDKLKAATGTKEFTRLAAWSHYTKHHQPRQTIFTRQYKILSKGGSLKAYIGSVKKLVPSIPIQSQTSRRKRVLVHVHFQSRKKTQIGQQWTSGSPFHWAKPTQAEGGGRTGQLGPWPHI